MKIGRYVLIAVAIAGIAFLGWHYWSRRPLPVPVSANASAVELPMYGDSVLNVRAPDSVRIKVEVLNATATRGMARQAALYLRDRGFDVVLIGNSSEKHDSTLVLDRTNHEAWAKLIATAMSGHMEAAPDTSRYVDVTVLVGGDWRPPPEPFYP